jgi:Lipase (class 3)
MAAWILLLVLVLIAAIVLFAPSTAKPPTAKTPSLAPRQVSLYDTSPQSAATRQNYTAFATLAADIYTLAVPNTGPTPDQISTWAEAHGLSEPQLLYSTEAILSVVGIKSQPLGLIAKVTSDPTTAFVIFRGSQTAVDWINNVNFLQTDLRVAHPDFPPGYAITTGYAQLYGKAAALQTVGGCTCASQCTSILGKSQCLTQNRCGSTLFGRYYDTCVSDSGRSLGDTIKTWVTNHPEVSSYLLTGHSLGGAPATLAALHLSLLGKRVNAVYTFASPRVGNPAFVQLYNSYLGSQTFRFAATNDPVPLLPLVSTPLLTNCFQHVGRLYPVEYWPANTACNPKAIALLQHRVLISPNLFDFVSTQLQLA